MNRNKSRKEIRQIWRERKLCFNCGSEKNPKFKTCIKCRECRRKYRKEHTDWRQKLMDRDNGCIICGESKGANAHHLLPDCVKYREFQFDPSNGVMLCPAHHLWGIMSAHKNPFWFARWMRINRNAQYALTIRRLQEDDNTS